MSDHFEHNPGDHEDPLAGPTWLVGFIGVILLVVTFLGLTSVYYIAEQEDEVIKSHDDIPKPVAELWNAQQTRIERPARMYQPVLDGQNFGEPRIAIPIDQAMDLIVEEAAGG